MRLPGTRRILPEAPGRRRPRHGLGHRRGGRHDSNRGRVRVLQRLLPNETGEPSGHFSSADSLTPCMQGEISALINLVRTLGGFSVAYFQVPWATKNGALQTFGVEAAIVAALFLLIVPVLQWKGASLRVCGLRL